MFKSNLWRLLSILIGMISLGSACSLQTSTESQPTAQGVDAIPITATFSRETDIQTQAGEVIPAIVAFSGEPGLQAIPGEKQEIAFGQELQLYSAQSKNGDRVRYEVNTRTGGVVGFVRLGQSARSVSIDLATAQQTALTFAQEHYPQLEELGIQPRRAELVDQGSTKIYVFWWVHTDPTSGAYLPQEVYVWVNPETGQVDNYSSQDVAVTISTQPSISKEQAIEIALASTVDLPGAQVVDAMLFVSTVPVFESKGEQALLWNIVVQGSPDANGYAPGLFVFIDAKTGEVVHTEPFA